MKIFKKLAVSFLAFCVTGTLALGAAGSQTLTIKAADKKEYTYTVRFFSGAQGTFGGKEFVTFKNLKEGERVSFRQSDVTMDENSKYYIRGIRQSGRDNNTVSNQSSFVVTEDQDYVVAYGIKGNYVGYTVRYVDADGRELLPDETYYGNVGDRPVIAYQYVENYAPQAYNLTGTLKENEAENVFTFTYTRIEQPAAQTPATPAQTTTPAAGNAGNAGGTAGNAGGAAGNAAGNAAAGAEGAAGNDAAGAEDGADTEDGEAQGTPDAAIPVEEEAAPAALQDIEDGEVPLANIGGDDQLTNVADEPTPLSSGDFARRMLDFPMAAKIGVLSLFALLAAGGAYLYIKKKKEQENAE